MVGESSPEAGLGDGLEGKGRAGGEESKTVTEMGQVGGQQAQMS